MTLRYKLTTECDGTVIGRYDSPERILSGETYTSDITVRDLTFEKAKDLETLIENFCRN